MVPEQREFGTESAEYLESNEVYDLFSDLLQQVIINQPDNPLRFLQEKLASKPKLTCCVVGPPGVGRAKYCEQIAADFGVRHISVGQLLKSQKELQETIADGDLVEDSIVIDLVKAEIKKLRAKGEGWVLDGFPRTKVQARALCLKESGYCVDRVLLLTTGERAIREHWIRKVGVSSSYDEAEVEDMINRRLQQYQRHIISLVEFFQNTIRQIAVTPGDDDQSLVYSVISSSLNERRHANAPLRTHRICIIGLSGVGRTTQSRVVAQRYGLVHVDPQTLLQKHQKATGQPVEDVPLEFVADEEICMLVGRRLSQIDCVRKGWVLDGFPKTEAQAEFLRQSHLWPTRLIHLTVPPVLAQQMASTRMVDPETAHVYYKDPTDPVLAERLVKAPHDEPAEVERRATMHEEGFTMIKRTFMLVTSEAEVGQEIQDVSRSIQDIIETATGWELAQDPNAQEEGA
jgi:adenylate kinase